VNLYFFEGDNDTNVGGWMGTGPPGGWVRVLVEQDRVVEHYDPRPELKCLADPPPERTT
jgi:hypothetical protein